MEPLLWRDDSNLNQSDFGTSKNTLKNKSQNKPKFRKDPITQVGEYLNAHWLIPKIHLYNQGPFLEFIKK